MTGRKYTLGFIAALICAVLFAALTSYLSFDTSEYVGQYSKSLLKSASGIINSYSAYSVDRDDYERLRSDLRSENAALQRYVTVLTASKDGKRGGFTTERAAEILSSFNLSESEAQERMRVLNYCVNRLDYALGYSDYIDDLKGGASAMMSVSIFDDSTRKDIIKTENAFYGFENLRVSAEPDEGVKMLLKSPAGYMTALIAALICAALYAMRSRAAVTGATLKKGDFPIFTAMFAVCAALIFVIETFAADRSAGLGALARPIQSVSDFMSCPHMFSVGTFLIIRLLFRTAACLTMYLIAVGAFSCKRRKAAVIIAAAALSADAVLAVTGAKVGLFAALCPERALSEYDNVKVLGESVSFSLLLTLLTAALLVLSLIFAARTVANASMLAKEEAEREYFDEVNRRYNEARLIRHDISNHLAAVAMLMDKGDYAEARRYLGDVSERLDDIRPPARTGSTVLDALLFRKVTSAKESGTAITLEFAVDLGKSGISDYDLCGVFSNLLDNAVEACGKLPESDRNITLRVRRQNDMVLIFCENGYADIRREGDSFATTKQDSAAHGLGLRRIERIAAKYGGSVDMTAEDGVFTISVLMNLKK